MEAFSVTIGDKRRVDVSINGITISGNGGYSAGYADGKADAEAADALEDAALLNSINAAISATGADAAEKLDTVAERIPEVYDCGYEAGEKSQYIAEIKDGGLYVRTKTYAGIENNVLYLKKENTV